METHEVLDLLDNVRPQSGGWAAFCPAHGDDRTRHLSVHAGDDGRTLLHCKKGCDFASVVQALGLEPQDLFPDRDTEESKSKKTYTNYAIKNLSGQTVAVHVRIDTSGPGGTSKDMRWKLPDGTWGLNGMPVGSLPLFGTEVLKDRPKNRGRVVVVEGEKSVVALRQAGITAVGTVTGANGTPSKDVLSVLRGRKVVLWPDNDENGPSHMRRVGNLLSKINGQTQIEWFEWKDAPHKGDAADHPDVKNKDGEMVAQVIKAEAVSFVPDYNAATDGATTFERVVEPFGKNVRLKRHKKGVTGIKSGIGAMDRYLGGWNRSLLYLVAARPSVGKSLLVGQAALSAAMLGHRVLLQSSEMSAEQYMERFSCYLSGVEFSRFRDGRMTDKEEKSLLESASYLSELPIYIDDFGRQTIARIHNNISQHEPELLVVDYLQKLVPDEPRASRVQQVGQLSRDISRIKLDYGLPVVAAAQLNRSVEGRESQAPKLSDLRDTGELEQDADAVILMHHKEGGMHLDCAKFRVGPTWYLDLSFAKGQYWLVDPQERREGSVGQTLL